MVIIFKLAKRFHTDKHQTWRHLRPTFLYMSIKHYFQLWHEAEWDKS